MWGSLRRVIQTYRQKSSLELLVHFKVQFKLNYRMKRNIQPTREQLNKRTSCRRLRLPKHFFPKFLQEGVVARLNSRLVSQNQPSLGVKWSKIVGRLHVLPKS